MTHEEKRCPLCNQTFTCKREDIANCQCSGIELLAETGRFLEQSSMDCICRQCLLKINQEIGDKNHFQKG